MLEVIKPEPFPMETEQMVSRLTGALSKQGGVD